MLRAKSYQDFKNIPIDFETAKFYKYSYKKVIKKALNKPLPSITLKIKVVYLPLKLALNEEILHTYTFTVTS